MNGCGAEGETVALLVTPMPPTLQTFLVRPVLQPANLFFSSSALSLFQIEAFLNPFLVFYLSNMLLTHFHVPLSQIWFLGVSFSQTSAYSYSCYSLMGFIVLRLQRRLFSPSDLICLTQRCGPTAWTQA